MLKLSMTRLLSSLPSLPSLAQCNPAAQPLVFHVTSNLAAGTQPLIFQTTSLHTTTSERSRIKQVFIIICSVCNFEGNVHFLCISDLNWLCSKPPISLLIEHHYFQTTRHKAFWHIKKLNKAGDEPVSKENKEFLQVPTGHTLIWGILWTLIRLC